MRRPRRLQELLPGPKGTNRRQDLSRACRRRSETKQRRFRVRAAKCKHSRDRPRRIKPHSGTPPSTAAESITGAAQRPEVAHRSRSRVDAPAALAKPPGVRAERLRQRRRASRVRAAQRTAHAVTRQRRSTHARTRCAPRRARFARHPRRAGTGAPHTRPRHTATTPPRRAIDPTPPPHAPHRHDAVAAPPSPRAVEDVHRRHRAAPAGPTHTPHTHNKHR